MAIKHPKLDSSPLTTFMASLTSEQKAKLAALLLGGQG